jgi:vacuolar-type H+-ATPase subunit I/STV1
MKFELTQEQVDSYHLDEVRAEIRSEISSKFTESDTVEVVGPDGQIWDVLTGTLPDDGAVVVSPEELEARAEKEKTDASHIEYLEKEIRPQVMAKLRTQARSEVREQLRDKSDEILKLRSEIANLKQSHQKELLALRKSRTEKDSPTQPDNLKPEVAT